MNRKLNLRHVVQITFIAASVIIFSFSCSVNPRPSGSVSPQVELKGLKSVSDEISSLQLSVKGTGIDFEENYPPGTEKIALTLPEAKNVRFEVKAPVTKSLEETIYSYGNEVSADLEAGKKSEIELFLAPYDTKLLVPDNTGGEFGNGALFQLTGLDLPEDVGGSPGSTLGDDWIEVPTITEPYDTALDSQGRIWFSSSSDNLTMFKDVSVLEPTVATTYPSAGLVFHYPTDTLYSLNSSNNELAAFSIPENPNNLSSPNTITLIDEQEITFVNPFGIAVDEDGFIYFAGDNYSENTAIFKLDPDRSAGNRVVATFSGAPLVFSSNTDFLIKNGQLYVTNHSGSDGNLILKFNKDLSLVDSFGVSHAGSIDDVGEFAGPRRFIGTANRSIYLIDDSTGTDGDNNIIKFNDTDGSGWDVYTPQDDSIDVFSFFNPAT